MQSLHIIHANFNRVGIPIENCQIGSVKNFSEPFYSQGQKGRNFALKGNRNSLFNLLPISKLL